MTTIAITGVTGHLGGRVAQNLSNMGISARYLARRPERVETRPGASIYRSSYENSPEAIAALTGVDVLLMVSAVVRSDVADVLAEILRTPQKWRNQILDMTGPEDLLLEEIARQIGQHLGKEIPYIPETIEEAYQSRKAWPAPQWQYDAWVSTYTAIAAGQQEGVSDTVERVLNRKATSLNEFLTQDPE